MKGGDVLLYAGCDCDCSDDCDCGCCGDDCCR